MITEAAVLSSVDQIVDACGLGSYIVEVLVHRHLSTDMALLLTLYLTLYTMAVIDTCQISVQNAWSLQRNL